MYYITILDYASGKVCQYNLLEYYDPRTLAYWTSEDFENFIIEKDHKLSNIEWMSHSDDEIYYDIN